MMTDIPFCCAGLYMVNEGTLTLATLITLSSPITEFSLLGAFVELGTLPLYNSISAIDCAFAFIIMKSVNVKLISFFINYRFRGSQPFKTFAIVNFFLSSSVNCFAHSILFAASDDGP